MRKNMRQMYEERVSELADRVADLEANFCAAEDRAWAKAHEIWECFYPCIWKKRLVFLQPQIYLHSCNLRSCGSNLEAFCGFAASSLFMFMYALTYILFCFWVHRICDRFLWLIFGERCVFASQTYVCSCCLGCVMIKFLRLPEPSRLVFAQNTFQPWHAQCAM